MNAGETSLRVYATLKERIASGAFPSGERLDPVRLAEDLASSTTPVRDALHRLAGEGLVESRRQEGFRQLALTEGGVRDLYRWSGEVTILIARSAFQHGIRPEIDADERSYPLLVTASFHRIALASPNREHRAAMQSLTDRMRRCYEAETLALADPLADIQALDTAVATGRWQALRLALIRFYRRRVASVAAIVSAIP